MANIVRFYVTIVFTATMANIYRFYVTTVFTALLFHEGGMQKAMQWLQGNFRLLDYTYTTFEVIENKKEWPVRWY